MRKIHIYENGHLKEIWETPLEMSTVEFVINRDYQNAEIFVEPTLTEAQDNCASFLIMEGLTTTEKCDEQEFITNTILEVSKMTDEQAKKELEEALK